MKQIELPLASEERSSIEVATDHADADSKPSGELVSDERRREARNLQRNRHQQGTRSPWIVDERKTTDSDERVEGKKHEVSELFLAAEE